jgi:hypothetical protein
MHDFLTALAWVVVNALLGLTTWRVVRLLFPSDPFTMKIVHCLVLSFALITATTFLLSITGLLYGHLSLLVVGALALLILCGLRRLSASRRDETEPACEPPCRSPGVPDFDASASAPAGGERYWLVLWAFLFCAWASHTLFSGLLEFPLDWDTLMYHTPLVDQWLHAHRLYAPDAYLWSNPGGGELIGLWIVGPFSGDFLIALSNFPAVVLLALGTVQLASALNLDRPFCHAAGLVAVANSVVVRQLVDAGNDVLAAAYLVGALCYGVRYVRGLSPADLALGASCLGLLAGTKFYALGYAAALWCVLVLVVALSRGRRPAIALALGWALGALAFAGYWYVRNTWVTGSPFYPKGLSPADDPLTQVHPNFYTSSFLGNGRSELLPLALEAVWKIAGPCHLAALVALPPLVGWLLVSGTLRSRRPGERGDGAARCSLALLLVLSGLVLVTTPFTVENEPDTLNFLRGGYHPVRFATGFLTLTVVALAVLVHDLSRAFVAAVSHGATARLLSRVPASTALTRLLVCAVPAVFVGAAVFQQATLFPKELLWTGYAERLLFALDLWVLGLIGLSLSQLGASWLRFHRAVVPALAVAGLVGCAWATSWLGARWHHDFARTYDQALETPVFSMLAARAPAASRLCVLDYEHYPFFGSDRRFRVCQPFRVPSYPWLLDYIRQRDVAIVVALNEDSFTYGRFHHIRGWLEEHPDVFQPTKTFATLSVFRVRQERLEAITSQREMQATDRPTLLSAAGR